MLFPIELHILKRPFDNINILLVAVQARDEKQRELRREESEKENEWEEKREITRPSPYPIRLLFFAPPPRFERLELHAGSLSQSTFIMLQSGPHPTPAMECRAAFWTTFGKLQTLQLLNGGWREYGLFCSPWGQCLNNFVSLHNRRFMSQATGGERGILREARDEVRRILAIPTLVSRFAQNTAFNCTLVFC